MKFFARIKDIFIRFLTKIKCNSSCFNTTNTTNTTNNIDDHSMRMRVERIEKSPEFQNYLTELINNSEHQEAQGRIDH